MSEIFIIHPSEQMEEYNPDTKVLQSSIEQQTYINEFKPSTSTITTATATQNNLEILFDNSDVKLIIAEKKERKSYKKNNLNLQILQDDDNQKLENDTSKDYIESKNNLKSLRRSYSQINYSLNTPQTSINTPITSVKILNQCTSPYSQPENYEMSYKIKQSSNKSISLLRQRSSKNLLRTPKYEPKKTVISQMNYGIILIPLIVVGIVLGYISSK